MMRRGKCTQDLKEYVRDKEIDGTKIQNEWFPQVKADIFISHSHEDETLACALAGWIYINFGLTCFIDSNVWGYSEELLEEMNAKLSNKRRDEDGGYLYNHESCNRVSQHVNTMLSIALQKMIDKVESVIFLNTDNSVRIRSDWQMYKTYSPWIYSEIICTQVVRKKPLIAYRNYKSARLHKAYMALSESLQFVMHSAISYTVSLKHLKKLEESDLDRWQEEYRVNESEYEYPLDALYEFMCAGEVGETKKMFEVLDDNELNVLKHAYSVQNTDSEECANVERVWMSVVKG